VLFANINLTAVIAATYSIQLLPLSSFVVVFARELGVPIVMHDYLIGGFIANTTLVHYCCDRGLLLHIHRAIHTVIDRQKSWYALEW
jgi:hypothetical protein